MKKREPDAVKPTVEYQVFRGEKAWCDVHIFASKKQAKAFAQKGEEIRTVTRHPAPAKR